MFKVDPSLNNEVLKPWLSRLATQQTTKPSDTPIGREIDKVIGTLRGNANQQLMFVNVVNTVENLSDIPALGTKVKYRNLYKGLMEYKSSPKAVVESITEKSPYMKVRMENTIYDINETYSKLTDPKNTVLGSVQNLQKQASKHAYILQKTLQDQIDVSAWLGAYNEKLESGASEKDAIKHADSVIRLVLGSNRAIDMAKVETGGAFQKVILTFYSYFLNKGNLVAYSGKGNKLKHYALGIAAPAILAAAFRKSLAGKEEKEKELIDDLNDVFFLSQIRFNAAIIPGGGTAWRFIEGQFTKKTYDDRLSISPLVGMVESVRGVKGVLTKDELKSRDIKDTLNFFGTISGLPLGAFGRPLGFMIDLESGKQDADNPLDYAQGLLTGKSGKE